MFGWLRVVASRIRGWFTIRRLDEDFQQELDSHLALLTEENLRRGLTPEEARRAARVRLGGVTQLRETHRELQGLPWLEALAQDLRYALRMLRKNPGFTAVVVVTIALGIGASTAVFSVVDPLLFRRLPYPQDDQLVSVGYLGPVDNNEFNVVSSYFDWRQAQTPFQFITAMRPGGECDVLIGDTPRQVRCYAVAADFLKTFRIRPAIGRDFSAEDDQPRAPTVVLLSYGFWQRAFGGDAKVLGKTITLNEEPAQVIGVLPKTFEMPQLGDIDVMLPARLDASRPRSANSSSFLRTFARLREGVSIEQARDRLRPLFEESMQKDVPVELRSEARLVVRSLRDRQIHDVKRASWLLLGSVIALFLVACINVANLMLARAVARRRELAMRAALGAGRGRLMRQALTESLMFGLLGGVAGCGAAWVLLRLIVNLAADQMPRLDQARIDLRVLLFALAGSIVAAVLFGVAPALERPRAEFLFGGRTAGTGRTVFRKALVAAQVAISLVLLTGASLLVRSLAKLENQSLGFQPEHVLSASFTLRHHRYQPTSAQITFYDELEARLKRIPAGGSFALSDSIPPRGSMGRPYSNMRIFGHPPLAPDGGMVEFRRVTPGYFQTMGIAILAGRAFTESECASGESPVILSATLARRMFGNENPVGQQIELDGNGHWCPIVGVAADTRNNGLTDPPDPEYYRLRMKGSDELGASGVVLFRTSLDPAALVPWIRKEFAALDPSLPVTVETMEGRVQRFRERPRFVALLVGLFAALGLLLAAVGLYGVLSFLVAQQTREIGVRMALGARPRDIAVQVQKHVGSLMGMGVAAGLAGSLVLARAIRGLLFEISPTDPISLLAAVTVLVVTAALAAWIPSSRAARVDPALALRCE
ncbi:MAG TPA: ABC transporter permease [Terriglobia bacterium]|nr:ABC transporter permease [Terriglobia bacterium]